MPYKAIRICSTFQLLHKEFEFIEDIELKNGYPKNFILAQIIKTLGRHYDDKNGAEIYSSKN